MSNGMSFILYGIIAFSCLLTSCATTKDVNYFKDLSKSDSFELDSTIKFADPKIRPDDILAISIITIDPTTSAIANQASTMLGTGTSTNLGREEITGFIVDRDGEVELALVGKIKLAGLTTYEARAAIKKQASLSFKNPTVNVRFANFKISVLGEVNRPASYTMPNEKVSILDVLSLAGDLTLYGKRENILVVRDLDGKKQFGRLNINSGEVFKSPFFYLKQNDVVYVEPTESRAAARNSQSRATVGIILSAVSVLVLAFTRVF